MKKIQPLNNNVLLLIEKEDETKKTAGGIIIPDTVGGEKRNEGVIVAIATDAPKDVKVGDTVLYKGFSGSEMTVDGKKHLLVQFEDLLAVYAKGDAI